MTVDEEITVVIPPTSRSSRPDTLRDVTALARFEFEPAKGNNGTKILMVEWQDDDSRRDKAGSWHVSWPGKSTVFSADDEPLDNIRRLYFLLPPGATVPPHITIAYQTSDTQTDPLELTVNPLPAIFTPELGATAKASGKKGVLHTIWAKKRLQVLEKEIEHEKELNLEGIALEMAVSERDWIEKNFGINQPASKPLKLDLGNLHTNPMMSPASPGLQSPKSPGGNRLTEKLKGLMIATSEKDLAGNRGVNTPTRESHPLSPETTDVAYSTFGAFRDKPAPQLQQQQKTMKRIVAQPPPDFVRQQQSQPLSLDFITSKNALPEFEPSTGGDSDLFAVALSPRSPDDPKSPFSIPSSETGAFSAIKGSKA